MKKRLSGLSKLVTFFILFATILMALFFVWWKQQPLQKVASAKNVAVSFKQNLKSKNFWYGRLRMDVSEDGINWNQLKTRYPSQQFRDGNIMRFNNKFYIVYTDGLMSTQDFKKWENLHWDISKYKGLKTVWAPEFFSDRNGKWFVIFAGEPVDNNANNDFKLYVATFNPAIGVIGTDIKQINGPGISESAIDPTIQFYNGKYILYYANNKYEGSRSIIQSATADDLFGSYSSNGKFIPQNKEVQYEAPEVYRNSEGLPMIYVDPFEFPNKHFGMSILNKKDSSFEQLKSNTVLRHFGVLQNTTTITLRYVNSDGQTIIPDRYKFGKFGESLSLNQIHLRGYRLSSDVPSKLKFSEANQTITLKFNRLNEES